MSAPFQLADLDVDGLLEQALETVNASFNDEHSDPTKKRAIHILLEFVPDKEITDRIDLLPHVKAIVPKRTAPALTGYLRNEQMIFPGFAEATTTQLGLAK